MSYDRYHRKSEQIKTCLEQQFEAKTRGRIQFLIKGRRYDITSSDVIGGVVQDWIGQFLAGRNELKLVKNAETQDFPDYFLDSRKTCAFEVKCYNLKGSPGFDLANFERYLEAVDGKHRALFVDADYLVVGYRQSPAGISLEKFMLKKIWQMTGPSDKYPISLQVKRKVPYNIRPKNFTSEKIIRTGLFSSSHAFLEALDEAAKMFSKGRYAKS
jgi:type II restriction enzyme